MHRDRLGIHGRQREGSPAAGAFERSRLSSAAFLSLCVALLFSRVLVASPIPRPASLTRFGIRRNVSSVPGISSTALWLTWTAPTRIHMASANSLSCRTRHTSIETFGKGDVGICWPGVGATVGLACVPLMGWFDKNSVDATNCHSEDSQHWNTLLSPAMMHSKALDCPSAI
ncbi:uncharacterized protein B0I36DRAFT_320852 [Microdochium trichocladiopsis]|uniref:Uncharacterized protein n=1 Tax=Microdochium trichocladiopsis TaxID=1682393 RepID=A0A9P8YB71_9PEZI|nr:uncharacterized protein B0I36DRAFT_320852 [Microdochium trichocladiopsis]KAH7033134.1 hypothetical protein B0I36DRAFT_320852 [Microdochium trichocladiopsis]